MIDGGPWVDVSCADSAARTYAPSHIFAGEGLRGRWFAELARSRERHLAVGEALGVRGDRREGNGFKLAATATTETEERRDQQRPSKRN